MAGLPRLNQPFVIGSVETRVGRVPQVSASWTNADYLGTFKARWGIGRMHYTVDPGLYALGQPDVKSTVFVTANYKMSFDRLRKSLPGRNAWILVLDTKGINVWCAAGKGTFGTEELVARIALNGLEKIVSHRELILPQLSAPGVAAHQVRKLSGFKAVFGPIRGEKGNALVCAFPDRKRGGRPRSLGGLNGRRYSIGISQIPPSPLLLSPPFVKGDRGGFLAIRRNDNAFNAVALIDHGV